MLFAVLAALLIVPAPSVSVENRQLAGAEAECLRVVVGKWDDGVSDASTIARAAMNMCQSQLDQIVEHQVHANNLPPDAPVVRQLHDSLVEANSAIALQDVLERRRLAREHAP